MYTIPVMSSGKYTLKLRSNDLLTEDYNKEFNLIVLEDVKNLKFNDDKTITFDNVEYAGKYDVFITNSNGNLIDAFSASSTTINIENKISQLAAGEYNITIYANSTDNYVFKSLFGSKLSFSVLSTPVVSLKNKELSWNAVSGATKYLIYKNNKYYGETTDLSFMDRSFEYGDQLYVVATSESNNQFQSNKSNIVKILTI